MYLLLHFLIQISAQNRNFNAFNVFFTILSHNNARPESSQRTVIERSESLLQCFNCFFSVFSHSNARMVREVSERSEYSLTVPSTGSAREEHKKHLNCCCYDSAIHFELKGIKVKTISLFFSVKNFKKPDIEGSAVVHHLRNVSIDRVKHWLE